MGVGQNARRAFGILENDAANVLTQTDAGKKVVPKSLQRFLPDQNSRRRLKFKIN
jgi:hypothetical protein